MVLLETLVARIHRERNDKIRLSRICLFIYLKDNLS